MGGIATDDHTAAKPRPRQQDRLDRTVDDVGVRIERSRGLRNIAAVLRKAPPEQFRIFLTLEHRVGFLRTNVKHIHQLVAERHTAGLATNSLQKFHAAHVVGPWHLHAPGSVAGRPRYKGSSDEMSPCRRANAVKTGKQIE